MDHEPRVFNMAPCDACRTTAKRVVLFPGLPRHHDVIICIDCARTAVRILEPLVDSVSPGDTARK